MEMFLLLFVLSLMMGFATSSLAKKLQRDPLPWFCAGFFFGLLGLVALLFMPRRKSTKSGYVPPKEILPHVEPEPFKEKLWFYLNHTHEKMGPINYTSLLQAWTEGKVSVKSYVWKEGMANWERIHNLPDLKALLEHEEITS